MPDGKHDPVGCKGDGAFAASLGGGRPMTLKEITMQAAMPKSTVFGLLTTMREYDVIEQTPDGKYALGLRLFEYGCQIGRSWDISAVAKPYMEHLAADCGVSVMLSICEGGHVITLDQVEGARQAAHRLRRRRTPANLLHLAGQGVSRRHGRTRRRKSSCAGRA